MPNQMIALSGRPAQIHSPASLAQRYGAVMNTLAQQRAAERQAAASAQNIAQSQQQMAFAAAQRGEESRAANQEFSVAEMARLLNRATAIERSVDPEATYQNWLNDVEHVDPAAAATFRQASPHYNPQFMLNVMGEAENFIRARVPTATAQTMLGAGGQAFNVVAGAPEIATATPVIVGNAPGTGAAPRAAAPPAAVPQMPFDEAFSDLSSDALTPAQAAPILGNAARTGTINQSDVTRLQSSLPPQGRPQVDQFINQRGVVVLPQSYSPSGGGQPAAQPLTLETAAPVIQAAVQNGNIGQNDLQALRQMVGPQMEPQLAQWMQQNNIRITPAGEPSMRSAVYRPGQDAAPQMTQVQNMGDYVATGRPARGRNPSVGQIPGSSLVSLPRVAAEAEAEREPIPRAATRESATTSAERGATRVDALRGEAPNIQRDTDNLVADYDQRILAIDRFFRDPYRFSIIGPIEGRTPAALQTPVRRDAQSTWDMIVNNDVIQGIIGARAQTETGGSPVGPVSDRDMQILIRMSNDLDQTGTDREQINRLSRLRAELVRQRDNTIRWYGHTMRPLGREASDYPINVRSDITPEYTGPATGSRSAAGGRQQPTRTRSGAAVSNW